MANPGYLFSPVLFANPNVLNLLSQDLQEVAQDLKKGGKLRKLFERIRDEVIIPSIDTNFEVGGRPKWEPLSQATFARRGGGGREAYIAGGAFSMKPLEHTGQLRRAATAKARFTIRNNEMTYGNWPARRWFGPVHDFGSQDGHIPQRQFAKFQPEDINAIQEITGDWVEDVVNDNVRLRYV